MVTTAERQQLREELVSQGYAWDYIDSWQPKTVLYRHAPGLDVNGKVSSPVGTPIKGVPGNPDYVARNPDWGCYLIHQRTVVNVVGVLIGLVEQRLFRKLKKL